MPKYWGNKFSRTGDSPKWVESKRRRERERLNDGNNNGQATHGARNLAWRTQAAWANKMLNMYHKKAIKCFETCAQ